MVTGKDPRGRSNAVIVELKQWEHCEKSDSQNTVVTWVGGLHREVLHPSVQVGNYCMFLSDVHTAFYETDNPVHLSGCSYLHNYSFAENDIILSPQFSTPISNYPLFSADDVTRLITFLSSRLSDGQGMDVLNRIEESKYRPSKKLMEHVGRVIRGKSEYILLDEQQVVYERVLASAREGFHDKKKTVIIIKGGPGTGKSVIAINLMADLLLKNYNAHYATGSRAFTETLRSVIGARGSVQFKYFNSYVEADRNAIDVLLLDESHRIRETSQNRFTPKSKRSGSSQIEELIRSAKTLVFFIDDDQIVRPGEIGSVEYIKAHAEKYNCKIFEYELEAQFRCNGSDAFVNWINNTLGIKRTANAIWNESDNFDFKILQSPFEVEHAIKQKAREGFSARMTAGFCWKWSMPNSDGTLVDDVVIDNYRRPWNAKPEAGRLANGIPKAMLWANDPNGMGQVGCVYTAQGFEFDYSGVIFGKDLVYDLDSQKWMGHIEESSDSVVRQAGDRFTELVKNTYRVLLSRGMKGCYVYFMDKDTERFFKSRMEDPISATRSSNSSRTDTDSE